MSRSRAPAIAGEIFARIAGRPGRSGSSACAARLAAVGLPRAVVFENDRRAASRNDAVVAQAVLGTRAVDGQGLPVLRRSITLVLLEAVRGKATAEVSHHPVALDLRDDRCGRDRRAEGVAM